MKPRPIRPVFHYALLLLFPLLAHSDSNWDNGANWPTYAPGNAPRARMLSLDEARALAGRGEVKERLYLRGEFRVTASSPSRAVLRDAMRPNDQSPRIVVEYPAGVVAPNEKDRFVRDAVRPYLIKEVRRQPDGVITIYVREIIAAEVRGYKMLPISN
jgi:hypothetical protein